MRNQTLHPWENIETIKAENWTVDAIRSIVFRGGSHTWGVVTGIVQYFPSNLPVPNHTPRWITRVKYDAQGLWVRFPPLPLVRSTFLPDKCGLLSRTAAGNRAYKDSGPDSHWDTQPRALCLRTTRERKFYISYNSTLREFHRALWLARCINL